MATLQATSVHAPVRFRGARQPLAAPRRAPARNRGRRCLAAVAGDASTADALFKPARRDDLDGTLIEVPKLMPRPGQPPVPSPFCTFSACALPTAPRSGPRNLVNLEHAFVSDEDRVMLKSIAYGNPTSAGAEDCNSESECNFTPQWCARAKNAPRERALSAPRPQVHPRRAARQPLLQAL